MVMTNSTLNSTCMPLDRCQHEVEVKCVSKSRPRCQMTWHASASIPAVLKDDVNGILNAIKKSNLKTSRWPHNFAWSFPQRSLQVSFVPFLVVPPFQFFLHGMWWKVTSRYVNKPHTCGDRFWGWQIKSHKQTTRQSSQRHHNLLN